jgi:O-antigen ligase
LRQRIPSLITAFYLLLCIALGGSATMPWLNLALQLAGLALIAWAAVAPRRDPGARRPLTIYAIVGVGLVLILIQLIPLPPAVWSNLPGRSGLAQSFSALGYPLPWLPISEAPYASLAALFAVIPAIAAFLATEKLSVSPRALAITIIAGMTLSIFLAAVQRAGGANSWAYLQTYHGIGGIGFFANKNHMGTLLLVGIPMASALVVSPRSERRTSTFARRGIALSLIALVAVGIVLNGSRAAAGLAVPVILASAMLFPQGLRWRKLLVGASAVALALAVVLVAQSPIASGDSDSASGQEVQRLQIWTITARAAQDAAPVGTGLGTFEQIYRQYEDPDSVTTHYVNHAHNDYLEILLEAGVPGLLLMGLFLAWWVVATVRIWRLKLASAFARAATIASGAILAHSFVDFPLRTAAISAIFAVCIALMTRDVTARPEGKSRRFGPSRHVTIG